jgi:site-specific recombinase XerD
MNDERKDLISEFKTYLVSRGLKKSTVYARTRDIKTFFAWIDTERLEYSRVRIKEAQDFQGWLLQLNSKGGTAYAKGTVLNIIKAATGFYEFLKTKNMAHTNPFTGIVKVKDRRKMPANIIRENEMDALLRELSCFENEPTNKKTVVMYRMHVLAELLYSTGMRIHEAGAIRAEDVDFDEGTIRLTVTKEGKPRNVFLNEYAKKTLRLYVTKIRPLVTYEYVKSDTLFNAEGDSLMLLMNRTLAEVCARIGIKRITCHGFRHSFGFHMLRAGCPMRYIQDFLGHSSLRHTELYTRVEKEDLRNVVERYHPRKWKGYS